MAPRRERAVRASRPGDADAYLSKAEEYLHAAASSVAAGNNVAAVGNAIHAAIAAADAIAAARAGAVWRGEHGQAPDHLEAAAGEPGRRAARHLRNLLPLKSRAEYDPDPVSETQARQAVQSAERILAIARKITVAGP